MKKNLDANVVFAEVEKMLSDKMTEINSERINYTELLEKTLSDIERLKKESDEAYIQGNVILGDELTKEKNILKERASSLRNINVDSVKKDLAFKYRDISSDYYKLVIGTLKEYDADDLKEAQELLIKLFEIANRGEARRQKAISLINQWAVNVVPYDKGETNLIHTRLGNLQHELDTDKTVKEIASGNNNVIVNY